MNCDPRLKDKNIRTVVFDDETVEFVLDLFGKKVDESGYIIESENGMRVLTPAGDEVRCEDFAGFVPGSEIVLTRDLPSLLQYANKA